MTPSNYQLMLEACSIYDESLTQGHANLVFSSCTKLPGDEIYDFVAYNKELDKRSHQMRVHAALLEKRTQMEAAAAAAVTAQAASGEGQGGMGDSAAADGGQDQQHSQQHQQQAMRGGFSSFKPRRFSASGVGSVSVGVRRRPSMSGMDDVDDDVEVDAPLPEGWPAPIPADVQLLAALDLPSLTIAKTKPGEMTFMQRQQLQAELVDVPADDDWSGLTRRQMTRLNNAPLALSLARHELQQGIRDTDPLAGGVGGAGGGIGFPWPQTGASSGVAGDDDMRGLPPLRNALSPIKSVGGASGRRTPTWGSDGEGPLSGRLSRASSR